MAAPGRGVTTPSRLEEHLQVTARRFKGLGISRRAPIASALPAGPDAITAKLAHPSFFSLPAHVSRAEYQSLLLQINPKLLLLHPGEHPARGAARSLEIPVANVLRHFEAGIFTLEVDLARPDPAPLSWKKRPRGVPIVLLAPGSAYRRLANRLEAIHPVIGIAPPSMEDLPAPHTVEHIATECVRILRRYRGHGPYALAGWRADSIVALEMARLLEEEGEKIVLVALLEFPAPAADRHFFSRRKKLIPDSHPWYGKILHLRPRRQRDSVEWRHIAPQGVVTYDAPAEMLAEPNIQLVATILAAELHQ
jgi:hypothetical protein